MRQKLTPEELEQLMVNNLMKAIYPVLYPVEQQCVKIQAKHQARVWRVALEVWRKFQEADE